MPALSHTLHASDGVRVSLDHYAGRVSDRAVIICPGFFQSKDTPTFQRMAQALAGRWDVLAMDFRGHGRSGGSYTFSAQEGRDLEAVLAWARPRYAHLGVLGFSMGGAITINTVSRDAGQVRSLCLVSAPSVFEDIEFKCWTPEAMRTGLKGLERGAGCRPGNPFLPKDRSVETIQRVQGIPKLFVHGTNDVIVGLRHSQRLFAAAQEPKRFDVIQHGSHAEALFRDDPDGFTERVTRWFSETLHPV